MAPDLTRRTLVLGGAATGLLAACATAPAGDAHPPIVFVHGNGDSAAMWLTTLWRFESNGWPRDRLVALDIPYPLARDDDTRPQEGRGSAADSMRFVAAEVERVRKSTGAPQVVLIALSRGGYAVRNFIDNGGAAAVSHAILCGTPNHGVFADPGGRAGSEFNGAGPFLRGLNAPKGPDGDEATPGVRWLTIRSDNNDKYAQPDGAWIGAKGTPTNVTFEGPALRGARNVVVPGIDHRETATSLAAFEAMFRFLTGRLPDALAVAPEARVVLDGTVSGHAQYTARGVVPTNLPLAGATVEVYAIGAAGERLGAALHRRTVGSDGRWGPFVTDATARHEFVVAAPGYALTHVYRSPFPRASAVVNLRAEKLLDADRGAAAVVTLLRPRGYLGLPRDRIGLDGQPPPGVPTGVPGIDNARLRLTDGAGRAVVAEFNGERIAGRAWPVADNEIVVLELTV